jgi:DNA invertase Pin-like site-specific DNA recombinase
LTADQAELARQLYDKGEKTVAQIADLFGVPRTTVYNHLKTKETATAA